MKEAIKVGLKYLKILEKIHELGFIHGDIKPNNMMISGLGKNKRTPYLIDFGKAMRYKDFDGNHIPN